MYEKSWWILYELQLFCLYVIHPVGSGALEKEEEFVQKCMESLSAASCQLDQVQIAEESILLYFILFFIVQLHSYWQNSRLHILKINLLYKCLVI